jgi:hypothetical protein
MASNYQRPQNEAAELCISTCNSGTHAFCGCSSVREGPRQPPFDSSAIFPFVSSAEDGWQRSETIEAAGPCEAQCAGALCPAYARGFLHRKGPSAKAPGRLCKLPEDSLWGHLVPA